MDPKVSACSRVALIVLIGVVAACSGGAATPPAATPSAGMPSLIPTATATASQTAAPGATEAPAATRSPAASNVTASAEPSATALGTQPLHYGNLDAGSYRTVNFLVPLSLTVEDGVDAGFASIVDEKGYLEFRSQHLASDQVIFDLPIAFSGAGAKSVFGGLRAHKVPIGKETPVTIGGLSGTQVEFTMPSELASGFGFPLFEDAGGTYFTAPQEHDRVIVLDAGDRRLLVLVAALSEQEFATFGLKAQKLLDTVHFE